MRTRFATDGSNGGEEVFNTGEGKEALVYIWSVKRTKLLKRKMLGCLAILYLGAKEYQKGKSINAAGNLMEIQAKGDISTVSVNPLINPWATSRRPSNTPDI